MFLGLYYRGTCLRTTMTLVGPYCNPLHVQSSPCSSWLLTTLTTQEGGAPHMASEPSPQCGGQRRGLGRNEQEPLKMHRSSRRRRGVRGLTSSGAGACWR